MTDSEMNQNRLEIELTKAVEDCINLVNDFPYVAIYLDPFDHTTLVVKHPGKEAEALFGFDYCEWRQLVDNNLPDSNAIREYVRLRIGREQSEVDYICASKRGKAVSPKKGKGRMPKCNSNIYITNAVMNQLLKTTSNHNVVFSPLGVASILNMLLYGTKDRTLISQRIYSLLDGFSIDEFNRRKLIDIVLEHATSMWYDRSLGLINESYVNNVYFDFGTEPYSVNFARTDKVKTLVNKWVSKETHGMIQTLDLQLSPYTLMLLIDALYMKAEWYEPFDEGRTIRKSFYNADGTSSSVDMMHIRTNAAEYVNTYDYQAINLHYKDRNVFMTILLPHKGKDLNAIMRFRSWLEVKSTDNLEIELEMPKFKIDSKVELKETLSALGLNELFDTETALPEISNAPVHVSQIFQQCAVSVAEQGTEASAVTVAEMAPGCMPPGDDPKCHYMIVDRPFGFAIQDINHNVLFMGVVNHLDNSEQAADVPDVYKIKVPQIPQKPEPVKIKQHLTSVTVAGTSHIKGMEALATAIDEGTQLLLKHERDNKYDRNAIGVYLGTERVGFIPKEKNEILANLLDADIPLRAIVTDAEWRGNWFCIKADIAIINGQNE